MRKLHQKKLFPTGQVVITREAQLVLEDLNIHANVYIKRHERGDWGDLCDDDKLENEKALETGGRLFSSYQLSEDKLSEAKERRLWIITEANRRVTTVMLPDEY